MAGGRVTEARMAKSSKLTAAKTKAGNTDTKLSSGRVQKASGFKTASKHDQLLDLLRRKQGASLAELQKTSGWQAHSLRGFLAGTVKKRHGLQLNSAKSKDGERRYSIASA
jgi:hypothetical protein